MVSGRHSGLPRPGAAMCHKVLGMQSRLYCLLSRFISWFPLPATFETFLETFPTIYRHLLPASHRTVAVAKDNPRCKPSTNTVCSRISKLRRNHPSLDVSMVNWTMLKTAATVFACVLRFRYVNTKKIYLWQISR